MSPAVAALLFTLVFGVGGGILFGMLLSWAFPHGYWRWSEDHKRIEETERRGRK